MLNLQCPYCNQGFIVDEDTLRTFCPNPACRAIVYFAIFGEKQSALAFHQMHQAWQQPSLGQIGSLNKWFVSFFNEPLIAYSPSSLSELVSEEVLQSIQAGFADYLGGPLTLFEVRADGSHERIEPLGKRSTKLDTLGGASKFRNFSAFCRAIRQHRTNGVLLGDNRCHENDCHVIDEAVSTNRHHASWHFCWCGLVDFTAPISVNEKIMGLVFTGQNRPHDTAAQNDMRKKIGQAAQTLGWDTNKLTAIAFSEEVEAVSEADIAAKMETLQRLAADLEHLAAGRYELERELRERRFTDSLSDIFTEFIEAIGPDPKCVWPMLQQVLKAIRVFMSFPLAGLWLIDPSRPQEAQYVAGNLGGSTLSIPALDADLVNCEELQRDGPRIIGSGSRSQVDCHPLWQKIRQLLSAEELGLTCLLPIASFGHRGVVVLTGLSHEVSSKTVQNMDSALGAKLLKSTAHVISEHLDISLALARVKADQQEHHRLMVSLGHEINLPIQSMLADSANIIAEMPTDSEILDIAKHNLEEIMRLHLFSENIMGILSQRSQSRKPEFNSHSVYRPLREACGMFEGEARAKGCDIAGPRSIGSQFPVIEMSLFDLTLAFKNLLHNAVKYSFYPPKELEAQRYVSVIGQWESQKEYKIEISNYGVGITPKEITERLIFRPYYRGESASDRHRTGSGLGLTHVQYVIEEQHGGRIEVKSVPMPGTAFLTVFKIILPVSQLTRVSGGQK